MFTRLKRSLTALRKTGRPHAAPAGSSEPEPKTVDPGLETIASLEDAVVVAKRRDDPPRALVPEKKPLVPEKKAIETKPEPKPEMKPEAKPAKALVPAGPVDRNTLINQAMRIREEKSQILDNLSPGDRARLRALAMKLLVGQPPKPDKLH